MGVCWAKIKTRWMKLILTLLCFVFFFPFFSMTIFLAVSIDVEFHHLCWCGCFGSWLFFYHFCCGHKPWTQMSGFKRRESHRMENALFQWVRHHWEKNVLCMCFVFFKCVISHPFRDYLSNSTIWSQCIGPEGVVSWHLSLFSVLLVMGLIQIALCAVQVVNGLLGALCGDCCGCCGGVSG